MKILVAFILGCLSLAISAQDMEDDDYRAVIGVVVTTDDITMDDVGVGHNVVTLESRDEKKVVVDLGNATKLNQVNFDQGDRVFVVGKETKVGKNMVIFARYAGKLEN